MRHSKNYMENTKIEINQRVWDVIDPWHSECFLKSKEETLEENLACYTDILNQYCATLDEFTKEYKAQSKLICNSLKDTIKFLKN